MFHRGFLGRAHRCSGRRNVDIDLVTALPPVAMPVFCRLSWELLARIQREYLIGSLGEKSKPGRLLSQEVLRGAAVAPRPFATSLFWKCYRESTLMY